MKTTTEKAKELIDNSGIKQNAQFSDVEKFIEEVKKSGFIKKPSYTLPLADTIGRKYYTSINKR